MGWQATPPAGDIKEPCMDRVSNNITLEPRRQGLSAHAQQRFQDGPGQPAAGPANSPVYLTAGPGTGTLRVSRVSPTARPAAPARPASGHRELSRYAQVIARVAWVATALLTLGLFTASLPARYEQLTHPELRATQTLAALNLPTELYAG